MIMSWFTTVPRPKMLPVSNALVALETLVQHFPATFEKPLAWRHSSEVPRPELRALRDSSSSASASPVVVLKALDAYLLDLCQEEEEAKELTQIIDHDQGCLHEAYYTFLHRRVHRAAMIRIGAMTPFVSIVSPEIDVQLNMLARILSSLDFLQPNKRPVDQLQRVFFSSQTIEWNAIGETRFLDLAAAPFPIEIEGKEWRPNHDANHTSGIRGWTYHHLTSAAEYIATDTQQDLSLFLKNMAGRIRQATIHWIHGHVALLLLYQHYGIGGIEIQDRIFVVDWSAHPRPPRRPLNDWRQVFGLVNEINDDSEDDDDTFEVRLPVEKQLAKFYRASLDTRNVPFVKRRIYELVALSGVSHISSIEPWPFARSQLDFVASFTLPTKDEQLRDEISRQIRFEKRGRRRFKDTTGKVKKRRNEAEEAEEMKERLQGRQVGVDAVQDFRNRIDDMMMDLEAGKYGRAKEMEMEEPDEAEFQRVQARILAEREARKRGDVIPNVLFRQ